MCGCQDTGMGGEVLNMALPESVSIDILQVYRAPIKCVHDNGISGLVQSTEEEIALALTTVDRLINEKLTISNVEPNLEDFEFVRMVAMKIISNSVCL